MPTLITKRNNNPSIKILYDNVSLVKGLEPDWGFSCLIKGIEKNILFDTGGNGKILFSNMEKLGVKAKDIDIVFLSHNHGDHTGGLWDFLGTNPNVSVYAPVSFPDSFKKKVSSYGTTLVEVSKRKEICNNVYSTGELGALIKEQSLVIKTKKGLVIITGCAHPGIAEIMQNAKEKISRNIYLALGGFHLVSYTSRGIKEIILDFKRLNVQKVGPCHCSGSAAIKMFKQEYGENFLEVGVGFTKEVK